ncbi:Ig-like domain repeat protein [Microbacterium sp. NPDC019599]|uniref:Ig-like domain repeat protein n=1 Tax=Microbacterium sp. NPDC019599 TaxID=3154690 RepID=UPI0033D0B84D
MHSSLRRTAAAAAGVTLALALLLAPSAASAIVTAEPTAEPIPVNTVPPQITGDPDVTRTIRVSPGTWTGASRFSYSTQWFKDGEPIRNATSSAYTVNLLDQGHVLSARVTAKAHLGLFADAWAEPVTARRLSVASVSASPAAPTESTAVTIVVRIIPSNVAIGGGTIPTGTVRISIDGESRTGTLVHGIARIPVGTLDAGRHPLVAQYFGDARITPTIGGTLVTVG